MIPLTGWVARQLSAMPDALCAVCEAPVPAEVCHQILGHELYERETRVALANDQVAVVTPALLCEPRCRRHVFKAFEYAYA